MIYCILGLILVLFMPGLCFTFVFWSRKEIDFFQRIVFSLLFSLVWGPLTVFYYSFILSSSVNSLRTLLVLLVLSGIFTFIGFCCRKLF